MSQRMIPKSGDRFPAFAKPASAGEGRSGRIMRKKSKASDDALVELFLDMQAAERGAGKNTLDAYRNDLADLAAHLRAAGRGIANATTDDLRGFLG